MNIPHLLSRFAVAGCVALAGCGGGTRGAPDADPSEGLVDAFAARVLQPILEPSCTGCHRAGKAEKGVILTSYEDLMSQGLVQPGDPAKSKLVAVITTGSMKRYVSPADVEAISLWIADGAPRWARAESLPPPGEPEPTRAVGLKACLVCHGAGPQFAGWLKGAHANRQNWDANTFQAAPGDLESLGFPYYGYSGLGTTAECTTACHDPLGDGQMLTAGLSGDVPRPVIGCESCHGGGAKHYGTGPIPHPRPDFTRCGQCHDGKFAHNPYHPEGDEIVEKYVASPHARSINDRVLATRKLDDGTVVPTEDVRALCSKCHTDEGARRYKNVAGGYADLTAALPDALASLAAPSPVQCRTCHNPHDPLKLLKDAQVVDGTVVQSSEFRTCTACHQIADALHGEASAYSWSQHAVGLGTLDPARIFYDTHFDDPATDVIEGYVLDPAGERACRGCHNVHAADATIQRQWANSGHGGRLLAAKDRAAKLTGSPAPVFQAGVDKADGPTTSGAGAWTYYDFKEMTGQWDGLGRQACQRCHTATGFRNFADSLIKSTPYAPAENQFVASGTQREMLYCWACHTNNVGGVRDPGAFPRPTAGYASPVMEGSAPPAPREFADIGSSNVCVPCHAGRLSGESIKASATLTNVDFGSYGSHYLAGAGVLYRTIGYEFPGLDYENPPFYQHVAIGTVKPGADGTSLVEAVAGTGRSGPCVACHMSAPEGHRLTPLARGEDGRATGTASPLCGNCHKVTPYGDYRLTPEVLREQEGGFHAALGALEARVTAAGFHYSEAAYPYFFSNAYDPSLTEKDYCNLAPSNRPLKNWQTGGTSKWEVQLAWGRPLCTSVADVPGVVGTGANNLGAAFNLVLLKHEPGAWAHNRYYAKRLIFDSIDWLADGALDGTIDLRANPTAAAYLDADPTKDFDAAKVRRP